MEAGDRFEREQAAREARGSVPGRPSGSRTSAIADALKRYLSAQSYRDRRSGHGRRPAGHAASGDQESGGTIAPQPGENGEQHGAQ